MPIKLENLGIAIRDLEATIAFFTDLGLTVLGRDTVSGQWTDTAVGLDGNHANIAMLQTPDGETRAVLELPEPPTALFMSQNLVTIGGLRALRAAGLRRRIAHVGFDDVLLSDLLEPGLTVVVQSGDAA